MTTRKTGAVLVFLLEVGAPLTEGRTRGDGTKVNSGVMGRPE